MFDHSTGDATDAYAPKMGLKKFVRHLIFMKPDVLIVMREAAGVTWSGNPASGFTPEDEGQTNESVWDDG